jgi:glyoxylase-like metal-dependent hydrolase (beta-lactamase superfamily II)
MELRSICGNTCVAEASTALIGIYRLGGPDVVLLDTGLARADREALSELLEREKMRPRGIICTHAHYDHTGNAAYLRKKYGAMIAAQIIEAGIGATPESYRANYAPLTYAQSRLHLSQEAFPTDVIIGTGDDRLSFCGTEFRILQLPGHTIGQIGVITPDNVAYLADSLVGPEILEKTKLPTSMMIERDLETKRSLRNLKCDAYIIAHKDVVFDIRDLVDRNIRLYQEKADIILSCLNDGMTPSQWLMAFSIRADFHSGSDYKLCVIHRNFSNFVAYLEDCGRITVIRDSSEKRYYHTGN